MPTTTPSYLHALCPRCHEVIYRSVRPLGPEERLDPRDFVDAEGRHPSAEQDALCPKCAVRLVFLRVDATPEGPSAEPAVVSRGGGVAVEVVYDFRDDPPRELWPVPDGSVLILTQRRLLRLRWNGTPTS